LVFGPRFVDQTHTTIRSRFLLVLVVALLLDTLDDDEEDEDERFRFSTGWRFTSLG